MKQFVIGDPHGANKALLQCLERSKFNKNDVCQIEGGERNQHEVCVKK